MPTAIKNPNRIEVVVPKDLKELILMLKPEGMSLSKFVVSLLLSHPDIIRCAKDQGVTLSGLPKYGRPKAEPKAEPETIEAYSQKVALIVAQSKAGADTIRVNEFVSVLWPIIRTTCACPSDIAQAWLIATG